MVLGMVATSLTNSIVSRLELIYIPITCKIPKQNLLELNKIWPPRLCSLTLATELVINVDSTKFATTTKLGLLLLLWLLLY